MPGSHDRITAMITICKQFFLWIRDKKPPDQRQTGARRLNASCSKRHDIRGKSAEKTSARHQAGWMSVRVREMRDQTLASRHRSETSLIVTLLVGGLQRLGWGWRRWMFYPQLWVELLTVGGHHIRPQHEQPATRFHCTNMYFQVIVAACDSQYTNNKDCLFLVRVFMTNCSVFVTSLLTRREVLLVKDLFKIHVIWPTPSLSAVLHRFQSKGQKQTQLSIRGFIRRRFGRYRIGSYEIYSKINTSCPDSARAISTEGIQTSENINSFVSSLIDRTSRKDGSDRECFL